MKRKFEHTGERFGRFTAIEYSHNGCWVCICDCGALAIIDGCKLRSRHTQSCGCFAVDACRAKSTTHGHSREPEFQVWKNMLTRCSKSPYYEGIEVHPLWQEYAAFLQDVGRRPAPHLSLDRINNAKGYVPGNVRWTTKTVQSRNTRNHVTNKTGVRGVSWSKAKAKWRAAIYVNNRQIHVGYFTKLVDAAHARKRAEERHWYG